jgi:hypothetical protein
MSNKKQTAIQELISEFQELKNTKIFKNSIKSIDECIDLAFSKLEMEKQETTKAFDAGFKDNSHYQNPNYRDSEQYYNENYENN